MFAKSFVTVVALIPTMLSSTSEAVSLPWVSNMLFSGSTMRLNEADLALSNSVTVGAYAAVKECANQFKYDRWNCPASAFLVRPAAPSGGKKAERESEEEDNETMTREASLVRAFTSAGITFTLTKNCSAGDFANCLCDSRYNRKKSEFSWGGCSDNYQFGSLVARQFLDGQESGADPVSLVNLHNNAAGRVAVKKTMRRMCKCHGVSGSCATQTCWRQISDFKAVGEYLRKGYKRALKVDYANGLRLVHGQDASVNNIEKRNGRTRGGSGNGKRSSSRRRSQSVSDSRSSRTLMTSLSQSQFLPHSAPVPTSNRQSDLSGQVGLSGLISSLQRGPKAQKAKGSKQTVTSRPRKVDNRSNFILSVSQNPRSRNRRRGIRGRGRRRMRQASRQGRQSLPFRSPAATESEALADALASARWRSARKNRRENSNRRKSGEEDQSTAYKPKKRHLVFLRDSPDYCLGSSDPLGYKGVLGRKCSTDPGNPKPGASIKKCAKLCRSCGLKPKKEIFEVLTTCQCRFEWNTMSVKCQTCKGKKVEITCVK